MKRLFFIAFIFLYLPQGIFCKQWIVFFAKEGFFDGVIRQSFGHAYVALIKEDPITSQNVLLGCWGFYPKGGIQSSGFIGYMEGEIRDDWKSMREDELIFEISEKELNNCLRLKKYWEKQTYSLRTNNCLHFIQNFGANISKLKLPKGFYLIPSNYICALRSENKDVEYKGVIKNIIPKESFIKRSKNYLKLQQTKYRDQKIIFFKKRKQKEKDDNRN